jgi:hypothetical protein
LVGEDKMKKCCKTCGWAVWPRDGRGRLFYNGDCTYPANIPESYADYWGKMPKKKKMCGEYGQKCGGWSKNFT